MIEQFLPQASSYAADIDLLILVIAAITGFWFFAAEGMFFWLLWRFRYKPGVPAQYVTGDEQHLKRWITIPHGVIILLDLVVIAGAVYVWYEVKQYKPENPDRIVRITAQQWAWQFVHPGADGKLDTDDDIAMVDELHVVVDEVYHYELMSEDVLHDFSVPVFRLKQDAIPGRVITGWFQPTQTGLYDIQCAEMCGIGHGIMAARLYIETPEEHAAWLASVSN